MRTRLASSAVTLGLGVFLALPAAVLAQDNAGTAPAPEQAKFHQLIGHWKGSGEWRLAPDQPASRWTTVATSRSVLGGHFVQEDVCIDFGEYAPAPLYVRTFYGYSRETKKWMSYSIDNAGTFAVAQVLWEGDKMLLGKSITELGQLVVERWVRAIGEDSYALDVTRIVGSGEPFAHVSGAFERQQEVDAAFATDTPAFMPAAPEMQKLTKWAGTYRLEGTMTMAPDATKIEIKATEAMRGIFGGVALETELQADPIPGLGTYEALGATLWSPVEGRYLNLTVDSLGHATVWNGEWIDDTFVLGSARTQSNVPAATQTLIRCDTSGRPAAVTEYTLGGVAPPRHAFEGSYTRQ